MMETPPLSITICILGGPPVVFTPNGRSPLMHPQRRGTGRVPADIQRSQALAAGSRMPLFAKKLGRSKPSVGRALELLGTRLYGSGERTGEAKREVADAASKKVAGRRVNAG